MSRQSNSVLMVPEPSDLPLSSSSPGTVSTNGGGRSEGSKPQHPPPMADWFKVYNDLLDEPNFRYALGRHQAVGTVYMALCSDASKRRSSVVPWTESEEIGTSLKLNLSLGILSECINALCEAKYVKKEPNSIVICNWDKTQSDYCKGISKGYYKKLVVSSTRGEERRSKKTKRGKSVHQAMEDAKLPASTHLPGEDLYVRHGVIPHELQ